MANAWSITAILPKDRYQEGTLIFTIFEDIPGTQIPLYQESYVCRGQGNYRGKPKSKHWYEEKGDTPTGSAMGSVINKHRDTVKYGPNKRIDFSRETIDGNLYEAVHTYGRSGLQIHGGRATTGKLMNTSGCIRVHDADMKAMIDAIENGCESKGIVQIIEE